MCSELKSNILKKKWEMIEVGNDSVNVLMTRINSFLMYEYHLISFVSKPAHTGWKVKINIKDDYTSSSIS